MFFLSWLTARGSGTGSVCLMTETDSPAKTTDSSRLTQFDLSNKALPIISTEIYDHSSCFTDLSHAHECFNSEANMLIGKRVIIRCFAHSAARKKPWSLLLSYSGYSNTSGGLIFSSWITLCSYLEKKKVDQWESESHLKLNHNYNVVFLNSFLDQGPITNMTT